MQKIQHTYIMLILYTHVNSRFCLTSYERLNLRNTRHKLKHSLGQDCFETKRNVDNINVFNKHSV